MYLTRVFIRANIIGAMKSLAIMKQMKTNIKIDIWKHLVRECM